jgi:hypothetical protein
VQKLLGFRVLFKRLPEGCEAQPPMCPSPNGLATEQRLPGVGSHMSVHLILLALPGLTPIWRVGATGGHRPYLNPLLRGGLSVPAHIYLPTDITEPITRQSSN